MKGDHPGNSVPVAATVISNDWPLNDSYTVFVWDDYSVDTPDDVNVVKPTQDPTTNGRWLKVDVTQIPQINTDWDAVAGISQILNKPSLASVATSGSFNDLTNKPALTVGAPTSRSVSLATAYQATDTSKPAIVTVNLLSTPTITLLGGGTTNIGEVRIGSNSTVSSGGGTAVGAYKTSLTGTLVLGVAITMDALSTTTFALPAGWYFAVRQTTGTGLSVSSAFDQSIN